MADTSTNYVKAKRKQLMAFLNTTPKGQSPTWNLMGKGITGQTVTMDVYFSAPTFTVRSTANGVKIVGASVDGIEQ